MLWIRICIDLALLDPVPYWECGSGYRARESTKIYKYFQHFPKDVCTYVSTVCIMTYYPHKEYFSYSNFSDGKVWLGSGSGFAWIRIESTPRIGIRIRIEANADPQHWEKHTVILMHLVNVFEQNKDTLQGGPRPKVTGKNVSPGTKPWKTRQWGKNLDHTVFLNRRLESFWPRR